MHTTQECRIGDARKLLGEMPDESVDLIATSPPYWGLRDYQVDGQIGLEPTLEEYHERLLEVTAECMRVLKLTGVMFWNHGDSYNSHSTGKGNVGGIESKRKNKQDNIVCGKGHPNVPDKCLTMQNVRLIMRMIDEQGWILRNRIIWSKTNSMPSSVQDRFSNKYEPVYLLVKSNKPVYYCNNKTGAVQQDKPPGTKGEEGVDWDWKAVVSENCITGEVSTKIKRVSNWRGHDYWFDLDAVRVPAKYAEVWSRKGAGKHTPYAQNNPRSRWGVTRKEMKRAKTADESYKPNNMRNAPEPGEANAFHPLGKNPGDVFEIDSPVDD